MFKVGDKVECIEKIVFANEGERGTVIDIQKVNTAEYFLIQYDNNVGGHNGRIYSIHGNNGVQRGKDGHCEWVRDYQIKLIEEEINMKDMLKAGRIVRTRSGEYGVILDGVISFRLRCTILECLSETLRSRLDNRDDIMAVFELTTSETIEEILSGKFEHKLIWRRDTFSEQDTLIAKLIPKNWKYIARDKSGELYLFKSKPCKSDILWEEKEIGDLNVLQNNFKAISFDNEEPTLIEDIIKFSF